MRPISNNRDILKYPLNGFLGTEAKVRILRLLSIETSGPLSAADIAEQTGLTVYGVRKTLTRLIQSGAVLRVGGGRKHQYEINSAGRLSGALVRLFQEEKERYLSLITEIKTWLDKTSPPPRSAWIRGEVTKFRDPLFIEILHESPHINEYLKKFRTGLGEIEKHFDLTVEIKGYTSSDVPALKYDEIMPLYGIPPVPVSPINKYLSKFKNHGERDKEILRICKMVSKMIQKDASLIQRAKWHIRVLRMKDYGLSNATINEWHEILNNYSIRRLSQFLVSTDERPGRLRQSNPFFAVLKPGEWDQITRGLEETE